MSLFSEIIRGKSIARILFNETLAKHCFPRGLVLDLASSKFPSYMRILEQRLRSCRYVGADLPGSGAKIELDLNKPLKLKSGYADTLFLFNAVYILRNPAAALKECRRILKKGGSLYVNSPFLFNGNPEPEDHWRITDQGLRTLLLQAGFRKITIKSYGERFSGIAYLRDPIIPRFLRLLEYPLALLLDKVIAPFIPNRYPLGYFAIVRK